MAQFAKNDIISVEIEDLAYGGLGVGKVDGFVVFVERALPGDRVTVRIHKKKSNHAQGTIEAIESPSPHRIDNPPCPLFGTCGGCTWQNFPYDQQLIWKRKQVADTINHLGRLENVAVAPILPSPAQWRYRNKMEYTFGADSEGRQILGFHLPGRFDRIFAVEQCLIQPEAFDVMLGILTQWARAHTLTTWHPRTHEGFLRYAVMRHSQTTGEVMLILITNRGGELAGKEALAERLAREVAGFKGLLWGLNGGVADVARIDETAWHWGQPELIETVNGLTFAISPQSFFQTNTRAAERLYARTAEVAQLTSEARLLDAYCGAGAIALHCARASRSVVGIEIVRQAIWDARANAARNGVKNATFIAAPLQEGLSLAQRACPGGFTHVIIDPPRGGMDKRSLAGLIALRAPTFVYVSCNPATLSRDLQTLAEAGYRLDFIQPVDMFPQTYHVETLVRLKL